MRRPGAGRGCLRDDDACLLRLPQQAPWYYGQWNVLTAEQVHEALARYRHQVVNEGCGAELRWHWDDRRHSDGSRGDVQGIRVGWHYRGDRVELTMAEDGGISGACIDAEDDP